MFMTTENGNIINSDYIINISSADIRSGGASPLATAMAPFLVKATGKDGEVYYLTRKQKLCEALSYIDDLRRRINATNKVEHLEE